MRTALILLGATAFSAWMFLTHASLPYLAFPFLVAAALLFADYAIAHRLSRGAYYTGLILLACPVLGFVSLTSTSPALLLAVIVLDAAGAVFFLVFLFSRHLPASPPAP